jgi:hypothetical protein
MMADPLNPSKIIIGGIEFLGELHRDTHTSHISQADQQSEPEMPLKIMMV